MEELEAANLMLTAVQKWREAARASVLEKELTDYADAIRVLLFSEIACLSTE